MHIMQQNCSCHINFIDFFKKNLLKYYSISMSSHLKIIYDASVTSFGAGSQCRRNGASVAWSRLPLSQRFPLTVKP